MKKLFCLCCCLTLLLGALGCAGEPSGNDPASTPADTEIPGGEPVLYGNENTTVLKTMFDPMMEIVPTLTYVPEMDPYPDNPNVKALYFSGIECEGRETKIFAYLGFPEGASADAPVPGVVLLHGGGGHAFADWVKLWNDRGYAAIAIDCFGQAPIGEAATPTAYQDYTVWPVNPESHLPMDSLTTGGKPFDEQWIYYCLSDIILSHNILRADERVDSEHIGATGISWGGYTLSLAVGYDTRFSFAVPVYGCGFLHETKGIFYSIINAEGIADTWEPSILLPEVKTPMLWVGGDNDVHFSVDSLSKSAAATENGAPAIQRGMLHTHYDGMHVEEIFRYADAITYGYDQPLISATDEKLEGRNYSCTLRIPEDFQKCHATLFYITAPLADPDSYLENLPDWKRASVEIVDGKISTVLPEDAVSFYLSLYGQAGKSDLKILYSSTLLHTITD